MILKNNIKKILFITGTRADFGKLKPLMLSIEKSNDFICNIFTTGMHLLKVYGETHDEIRKCSFKNNYLFINHMGISGSDKMDIILSKTVDGLGHYIREFKTDLIVVHGDRVEALAGAIVGALNNILVCHIEGGELSGTVDELIRHSITKLSHIHFVANDNSKKRLIQMGESENSIFKIGSPEVDIMLSNSLPNIFEVKKRYNIAFDNYNIFIYHPVTTDLDNLQSNIITSINALLRSKKNFNFLKRNPLHQIKHLLEYLIFKQGAFSLGAIRAGAFVGNDHNEEKHNFQINLLLASGTIDTLDKFNGVTVSVSSLNPLSTGYIKIKSENPYEDPIIQPNYFENSLDLEKQIKGIEIIRRITQTSPFSELIEKEVIPGRTLISRNDLIGFIKDFTTTIYHPTGTCKIGKEGDGVVDEQLRVWGIKNLRVCDASVFPESVTGNLVASCYLAGMVLVKDILS